MRSQTASVLILSFTSLWGCGQTATGGADAGPGSDGGAADGGGLVFAPAVTFTTPAAAATGVPINASVSATFNEAMDTTTLTPSTFTLKGPVTGRPWSAPDWRVNWDRLDP